MSSLADIPSDDIYTQDSATPSPNAGETLHIHRFASPGTDRIGYFLDTNSLANVSVNSQAIPAGIIAGPLQDFSIIEIGTAVIFWWRTRQALTAVNPTVSNPGIMFRMVADYLAETPQEA